jgi:hypothetical protein
MNTQTNNTANTTGNNNIVIQDVTANNITINVNGAEQKLEAAMNQWLVLGLVQKIAGHDALFRKFLDSVNCTDWQNQTKFRNAALTILQSAYIGVVGIYLKKLAAISNYGFSPEKMKEYLKNSHALALRLLDLANALLISALWDKPNVGRLNIGEHGKARLKDFFEQSVERDIRFSFDLFCELMALYHQNQLPYPLPEFQECEAVAVEGSQLHQSFIKIEELFAGMQNRAANGEDSFWAEKSLTDVLVCFSFLSKYKIQSVKEVDYHHVRSLQEYFIHKLSFYGLSNKRTEQEKAISENIRFSTQKIATDAVFVYKDDYFGSINLFPFVLDYNNVLLEQGTNLCVYSHRELAEENLINYISVADSEFLGIEADQNLKTGDFSEIYADKKSIIQYKKNMVVQLINKAKESILGKPQTDDDFLNQLLGEQ